MNSLRNIHWFITIHVENPFEVWTQNYSLNLNIAPSLIMSGEIPLYRLPTDILEEFWSLKQLSSYGNDLSESNLERYIFFHLAEYVFNLIVNDWVLCSRYLVKMTHIEKIVNLPDV
ncbi:hypothetical protein K7432_011440 [Basidiobolus ranarum]|uniref:Maturase K n=1 Tax=Basidiobolus ranarum TaxID=34480 RepID=A0ABR2WM93_9FUNG